MLPAVCSRAVLGCATMATVPHPPELHRRRVRRPRRGPDRAGPQPGHRRGDRHAPLSTAADVDRAVDAARRRIRRLVDDDPGRARAARCSSSPTRSRSTPTSSPSSSPTTPASRSTPFRDDEIPFMVDNLRFFAGAARCLEGRAAGEYMSGYTSIIRREPVGVIGQIAPWNYPLMMAVWKIGPALAAGNTIVLKPAETTPMTTLKLAELAAEIFPKGVLNVITGHGNPAGQALVTHPDVDMVSLTGSVDTGKWIAAHRRRHAQARPPRARRQGAGRRVRRRRPGDGARDDRRHRLLQRRPGLHRRDPRARQRQGPRRRRRRAGRAGQAAS